MDITKLLDSEIDKSFYSKCTPIKYDHIRMLFSILKKQDRELRPVLDMLEGFILLCKDEQYQSYCVHKIISFYGIYTDDMTVCRCKYKVDDNILVKTCYLDDKTKENINILLKEMTYNA